MNRLSALAVSLGAALSMAQAELPEELVRGLSPGQLQVVTAGLKLARPPECGDAHACLAASLANLRIAAALARERRTAEQIAATIGLPEVPAEEDEHRRFDVQVPKWAPARGAPQAPITIVTWLDYECPFSRRLMKTFGELEQRYPGKLRFVVRHRPLPFHPGARRLALMSMYAQEKGQFWGFHDALFALPRAPAPLEVTRAATALRLDGAALAKAPQQARYAEQLAADEREADAVGANGTPTSFVNGLRVEGAQLAEKWADIIDDEIAERGKLGK